MNTNLNWWNIPEPSTVFESWVFMSGWIGIYDVLLPRWFYIGFQLSPPVRLEKTRGSSIVFDNYSIWLFLFRVSSVVLNNNIMHAWDFESCDSWSFADVPKTFLFGVWNMVKLTPPDTWANYHLPPHIQWIWIIHVPICPKQIDRTVLYSGFPSTLPLKTKMNN